MGSCAIVNDPLSTEKCCFDVGTYFGDANYYCWVGVDCCEALMEDSSIIEKQSM